MSTMDLPTFSLVVTTRNRARSLAALLKRLDALTAPPVGYEIIVADNGSTDETPQLLAEWSAVSESRLVIRVEKPGKSRAANAAVRMTRGEWVVFLDDDVTVEPDYLLRVWDCCRQSDCDALQGPVGLPREATTDPKLQALLECYPEMLPQVECQNDKSPDKLVSANMAVRRDMLVKVGLFDERLGPGASGFGEDHDLADKILAVGGRLGYMPEAQALHEINMTRLTPSAYVARNRKLGRGDYIQKRPDVFTWILPRLMVTGLRLTLTAACGMRCERQRAWGRFQRYVGMLQEARQEKSQVTSHE